jgi:N-methylhydantoinase B
VKGGKAGKSFQVTIDPGGPREREVDALADAEPVRADEVIRIRTTGGGGWGDPLDRPTADVLRDVLWGKVSRDGAERDYAVVITGSGDDRQVDDAASRDLRAARRASADPHPPFFDRGPGFARLSGGRPYPDVDVV